MFPACIKKTTEQAGLHPWDPGTADVVAPQVWMAELLHSRHDLPIQGPLVGLITCYAVADQEETCTAQCL